jgi:hypothetical protein
LLDDASGDKVGMLCAPWKERALNETRRKSMGEAQAQRKASVDKPVVG